MIVTKLMLCWIFLFVMCDSKYWWMGSRVFREGRSLQSSSGSNTEAGWRRGSDADDEDDEAWIKYNKRKKVNGQKKGGTRKKSNKSDASWRMSSGISDNDYSDYSVWISDSKDNSVSWSWAGSNDDNTAWMSSNNDDNAWTSSNSDDSSWTTSDDATWTTSNNDDSDDSAWTDAADATWTAMDNSGSDDAAWTSSSSDDKAWTSSNHDDTVWTKSRKEDSEWTQTGKESRTTGNNDQAWRNKKNNSCPRASSPSSQSTCENRKSNCWSPGIKVDISQ